MVAQYSNVHVIRIMPFSYSAIPPLFPPFAVSPGPSLVGEAARLVDLL